MPEWTVYAQAAKGFLRPADRRVPGQPDRLAEARGDDELPGRHAARHSRWMLGADAYYIDFSNFLTQTQVPGTTDSTFVNGGGAIYKGVELEGQYALGRGFSLYGNYSANSAKYKGHRRLDRRDAGMDRRRGPALRQPRRPLFLGDRQVRRAALRRRQHHRFQRRDGVRHDHRFGRVFTADLAGRLALRAHRRAGEDPDRQRQNRQPVRQPRHQRLRRRRGQRRPAVLARAGAERVLQLEAKVF
ncbi:MAG: TonB-dependent receptor [Caulobacteraceae bacterium]